MTERPTATLFGCYSFSRDEYEARGGRDACTAAAELRIRQTARSRGHEPEGQVKIGWYDTYPGEGPQADTSGPFDHLRVWCRALTQVRIHAARAVEVGISCPRCGSNPEIRGDVLVCPVCDR